MLRVGFLGCGDVATRRARTMRALNERGEPVFDFVAACDLAHAKSADFAARFGGKSYSSVGRMLGEAELDALWICTPPSARGVGESAALAAGVALWIEPPVAATIRAGNALALQIKKSGVPTMVCAPHRYSPELDRLKRVLGAKGAAKIERWNGELGANLLRNAWRGDAKNGSAWLDGGWPLLDLLRFLGVEARKANAKSTSDQAVAALEWGKEGLASLGLSRYGAAHEALWGQGEGIRLRIGEWTGAPQIHLQIDRETTVWSGEDSVIHQLEAFARFLNSGKRTENRSPFADALLTLKLGLELSKGRS